MTEIADYIVIGGGSAGAVLAARLSEQSSTKVHLIEAGGESKSLLTQIPVGMAFMIGNPKFDWMYAQDPDPTIGDRAFCWSGGKMLGGSSSINGQVHIRGTRDDYDNWARLGATGWDFNSCLPYFIKSENFSGPPSQWRGKFGPVSVEAMRRHHALNRPFLESCDEFGMPTLSDYADGDMEGAFLTVATQRKGWRCSTEKAYLRPARKRPNLKITTHAEVRRIIFEGRRAVAVEAIVEGRETTFHASREIIISAGALGSPGLLLRSGVGPAEQLKAHGIDVVHDAPNVGENLIEHMNVSVSKFVNVSTYNAETSRFHMIKHLMHLLLFKSGALVHPVVQALALARTAPELAHPDVQLSFCTWAKSFKDDGIGAKGLPMEIEPAVQIVANICHPYSRGRVYLSPQDPGGVRISFNALSDERDLQTLIRAGKLLERIFSAEAWRGIVIGNATPDPTPTDDHAWEEFVRETTFQSYHPAGTCRMGSDNQSVVDPDARVRGVESLRVVDASIMPTLISANTNAPTIMIGEKIADRIMHP